jgi:hypothetical protein
VLLSSRLCLDHCNRPPSITSGWLGVDPRAVVQASRIRGTIPDMFRRLFF